MDYKRKYIKYKKKYIKYKKSMIGGDNFIIRKDNNHHLIQIKKYKYNQDKYKNEYDPNFFLDILESNNILITEKYEKYKKYEGDGAVYTTWSETLNQIELSCQKLLEKFNKNNKKDSNNTKNVIFIPMLTSTTGGNNFTKSNFWFSLLYLKELSENHNFHFDDILLIGVQNKNTSYLNEIKRNNLKINIFLFDDGVYTGTQLNSLLNSYISLCGIEFIQKIYITVPFLINKERFFNPVWVTWPDKKFNTIKDEVIKFIKFKELYVQIFKNLMTTTEGIAKIKTSLNKLDNDYKIKGKLKYNFLKEIDGDVIKEKYRDIIEYSIGNDNFNKKMDHWFSHKIPDKISLVQPFAGTLFKNAFVPPYKINWLINNEGILDNRDFIRFLSYDYNPNELIFNYNKENKNIFLEKHFSYTTNDTGKCNFNL